MVKLTPPIIVGLFIDNKNYENMYRTRSFHYYLVKLSGLGFLSMGNPMKNSDKFKNDPKWVKMAAEIQDGQKLMRLWKITPICFIE